MILVVAWDDELYIVPAPLLYNGIFSPSLASQDLAGRETKHRARPEGIVNTLEDLRTTTTTLISLWWGPHGKLFQIITYHQVTILVGDTCSLRIVSYCGAIYMYVSTSHHFKLLSEHNAVPVMHLKIFVHGGNSYLK